METIKALPPKSLDTFCAVFDFAKGQADITCPASDYPIACLRACERRGLLLWDIEHVNGKTKRWAALTALGAYYGCESLALDADGINGNRKRVWVKAQFDLEHTDYREAYRIAGELAQARLLAPTIRDLLQIHEAADNGDYSLFYQLYGIPETNETRQFESMLQAFSGVQQTMSDLLEENRMLREQLLNAPRLQNNAVSSVLQSVGGSTQAIGLKALSNPVEIKAPVFDEDDDDLGLEVTASVGHGMQVALNFQKSVLGLLNEKSTDGSGLTPRQKAQMGME